MIEYACSLLLVVVCIIIVLIANYGPACIIDHTLFPELEIFNNKENRDLMLQELYESLAVSRWTDQDTLLPLKYSDPTLLDPIRGSYGPFTTGNPTKFFCLSINNRNIRENINICRTTTSLAHGVPDTTDVFIAYFKPNILVPGIQFNRREGIIRCYIPYPSATGNSGIYINGMHIKWESILVNGGYILVSSMCDQIIWNSTNSDKYILIINIAYIQ
jgi:hypothetical protein